MIKKVTASLSIILMTTWFIMGTSNFLHAVTASYNQTVQIVDSAGNVISGVASAVTANYNETVRVVDSTGHVLDSFGGGSTPNASSTPQFAALGVGTAAPTATGMAQFGVSVGVGVPAAAVTGQADIGAALVMHDAALPGAGTSSSIGQSSADHSTYVTMASNASTGFVVKNSGNTIIATFPNSGTSLSLPFSEAITGGGALTLSGGGNVSTDSGYLIGGTTTGGVKNDCSGVITLAAGIGNSVISSTTNTGTGANLAGNCIKNYTNIGCMVISNNNVGKAPATPANTPAVVNCFASPTATATAGMAATATQTAIYAVASTANSTATILWWGQY